MIIDVLAAAVSRRLVHLEGLKEHLGITDTSADTALLRAIDIVSSEAVQVLGREPWRQQYKVRMPGDGGTHLALPMWPAETPSLVRYGVSSPTTMTASDYEITDRYGLQFYRWLYRSDEWAETAPREAAHTAADAREEYYEITYYGGWACPIRTWEASTAVRLGEYALATDRSDTTVFECTTAGTTHTSEPTWVTTDAATTTEASGVVWTARASAYALPESLHAAGIWAADLVYKNAVSLVPAGVVEDQHGPVRRRYSESSGGSILPTVSRATMERWAA